MREKHEWHTIKVWEGTYRRLKALAADGNVSLAQMLDEWSVIEENFAAATKKYKDAIREEGL